MRGLSGRGRSKDRQLGGAHGGQPEASRAGRPGRTALGRVSRAGHVGGAARPPAVREPRCSRAGVLGPVPGRAEGPSRGSGSARRSGGGGPSLDRRAQTPPSPGGGRAREEPLSRGSRPEAAAACDWPPGSRDCGAGARCTFAEE